MSSQSYCKANGALPEIPSQFESITTTCSEKCRLSRDYRITPNLQVASTYASLAFNVTNAAASATSQVVSYAGCWYDFVYAELFIPAVTQFRGGTQPVAELVLHHSPNTCDNGTTASMNLIICVPFVPTRAAGPVAMSRRDLNAILDQLVNLGPASSALLPGTSGQAPAPDCPFLYPTTTTDASGSQTCTGPPADGDMAINQVCQNLDIADFSFNNCVPGTAYCTYQANWPYPLTSFTTTDGVTKTAGAGCDTSASNIIVLKPGAAKVNYGLLQKAATLMRGDSSSAFKLPSGLQQITPTITVARDANDDLMLISKGPQAPDDIYIDCQPTGSDVETLVEFHNPVGSVASWGESFVDFVTKNAIFGAVIGALVMYFLLKFVKLFFRRLGATQEDAEDLKDAEHTENVAALASSRKANERQRKRGVKGRQIAAKLAEGSKGSMVERQQRRKEIEDFTHSSQREQGIKPSSINRAVRPMKKFIQPARKAVAAVRDSL